MESTQMVEETFQELERELTHQLGDLTRDELVWSPNEESNSICFLFWHIGRAEDIWVSDYSLKRPQVFERGGWASRWDIPVEDTGFGYGPEQLAAFPNPPIEELRQYHDDVRAESLTYLKSLGPEDFDTIPASDHPRRKGYTIGRVWGHLLCEIGQHLGHIAYLRGLQRGINQRGSVGDWGRISRSG